MDERFLSKTYSVRKLAEADAEAVCEIEYGNPIYYLYHPVEITPERVKEDMVALPPGKTRDDKYYVGYFDGETFVAIMDLVLGYPDERTAFIGFFMMNAARSGCGEGSAIVKEIKAALKAAGYTGIRLGVDNGNPQSGAFWRKNGFSVVEIKDYIVMYCRI